MISIEYIKNFFPPALRDNALLGKHLLKEYIQLMIMDYLASTPYIRKLTFIGGTCIRLTKGIDRFSEDLDFDIKLLSQEEFIKMTDDIIKFLNKNGLHAIAKDNWNPKLKAFRRNIHFPELLFKVGLSGHRDERFLIKIESQDQLIQYPSDLVSIKGGGYFFPVPVPSDAVLCAMKVSAMLDRKKGRDFYDAMFLLAQTLPDFGFLEKKTGITNLEMLKVQAAVVIQSVDIKNKMKDFEHLLFNKDNCKRVLYVADFFAGLRT